MEEAGYCLEIIPRHNAVYVDEKDMLWMGDFGEGFDTFCSEIEGI